MKSVLILLLLMSGLGAGLAAGRWMIRKTGPDRIDIPDHLIPAPVAVTVAVPTVEEVKP